MIDYSFSILMQAFFCVCFFYITNVAVQNSYLSYFSS